jgi:hypothetical protein
VGWGLLLSVLLPVHHRSAVFRPRCYSFFTLRSERQSSSDHRVTRSNQPATPKNGYQLPSPFVSTDRHRHSYNERSVLPQSDNRASTVCTLTTSARGVTAKRQKKQRVIRVETPSRGNGGVSENAVFLLQIISPITTLKLYYSSESPCIWTKDKESTEWVWHMAVPRAVSRMRLD